jgi:S4 domain protein YaaA
VKEIKIHTNYITLGQFLKHISIVSSGGEVKYFLKNNQVLINEEIDDRRGRKIYPGDKVIILGKEYIISHNEN